MTAMFSTSDLTFVNDLPEKSGGPGRPSRWEGLAESLTGKPGTWAEFYSEELTDPDARKRAATARQSAKRYCKKNGLESAARTVDNTLSLYAKAPQA